MIRNPTPTIRASSTRMRWIDWRRSSIPQMVAGGKSDPTRTTSTPRSCIVTWDDKVMEDEIFGPILPILTYKSLNEAFATDRGDAATACGIHLQSRPEDRRRFIGELSFGGGGVNLVNVNLFVETMPFGGPGRPVWATSTANTASMRSPTPNRC